MLLFTKDELDILNLLGLTVRQAEVYLSLVHLGPSSISTIAKNAQIERSEVFRVMPVLLEFGLVRKILSDPVSYDALAVSEGVTALLERASEAHEALRLRAHQLVQVHRNKILERRKCDESKYFLIYGQKAERRELVETLRTVERTLDCIIDWNRLLKLLDAYSVLFEEALGRGVSVRYLTNVPKHNKTPKIILSLKKKGALEIKRILAAPPAFLALVDNQTADIVTYDDANSELLASLWSTNADFTALLRDYFNLKWALASPEMMGTRKNGKFISS